MGPKTVHIRDLHHSCVPFIDQALDENSTCARRPFTTHCRPPATYRPPLLPLFPCCQAPQPANSRTEMRVLVSTLHASL